MVSVNRLKTIFKSGTIQNSGFFFSFSLPEILFLFKAVYIGCVWVWMAGKCDRNKYRIVWHPKGIPHLSPHSLWEPDVEFTLHLTSLYLHGESAWIRNNSIAGFHLSVFIFPTCRKMEWKGMEKEEKIVWKKLQPSKEMFDIDLDCEGGIQSQMCVFVIKQVWIFHLRQKARIFFFPGKTLCFTVVFLLKHHKHPFSPSSQLWPHPFIGSSFLEDRPFDFYSFEKEHAWVHSRNGREGLFVDLPSVKSQVGA